MNRAGFLFSLADVRCEHCQTKFRLQDFQSSDSLVCHSCGQKVEITYQDEIPHLAFDRNLVRPSPSVHIQREGSIFIIEKRWMSRFSRILLALTLLWNGLWISGFFAIKNGAVEELPFEYNSWILMSAMTTGIVLAFLTLRSLLNKTQMMIKNSKLVVSDTPLSLGTLKIFEVSDIQKLSAWKKDSKSGLPQFAFSVNLHLKNGQVVRLCRTEDSNEAAYLEKTLDEILTIEKTPRVVDPLVS